MSSISHAGRRFELTAAFLDHLLRLYGLPAERPPADGPLFLFAFRGLRFAPGFDPGAEGPASLPVETVTPDYRHMRCLLGIWERIPEGAGSRIFFAPGSTVPHEAQVLKAVARPGRMKGRGANQLEPGFYTDLRKGEHLQGKLNGHAALRQTAGRLYRRSRSGPPLTAADPLFFGNPYDNLHCGWNLDPAQEGYSSAGCLVVAGLPHCPRHEKPEPNRGPWRIFHDRLYGVPQEGFALLLLEGRDLGRAFQAFTESPKSGPGKSGNPGKPFLCYGSEGEAVRALQKRLQADGFYKGPVQGRLDVRTYRAWNKAGLD